MLTGVARVSLVPPPVAIRNFVTASEKSRYFSNLLRILSRVSLDYIHITYCSALSLNVNFFIYTHFWVAIYSK